MSDQNINGLITGLANGLNGYLGTAIQTQQKQQNEAYQSQLDLNKGKLLEQQKQDLETQKGIALEKNKNQLEDVLTPDMAEKALPGYGGKMINDYNKAHPDNPMKLDGGIKYIKAAQDHLTEQADKLKKSDDIRLTQYARTLSSDKEFSTIRSKRDNLENMKGLMDQVASQPDGPDRRQMYEQAVGQMRVLAQNGQLSEREIEHLLPSTFRGKVAQGLEWLTNNPQSTEAQAFLKRGQEFFGRESKITRDQGDRRITELSSPYKRILDRNQDVAGEVFKTYGVNHPTYNPASTAGKTDGPKKSLDDIFGKP